MNVVILAPHLDDAVFSCWHLIDRPSTKLVTVFAGIPLQKTTTLWDRVCGEPNAAVMVRKRQEEHAVAIKDTQARVVNLPYIDKQYYHPQRDIAELAKDVLLEANLKSWFYVPLAGGILRRHPDHIVVRNVGEFLLKLGRKVSFYADIPYMQMPSISTHSFSTKVAKRASNILSTAMSAEIHELSETEQASKQRAMLKYETQYKMVNRTSLGSLKRRANIEREMIFHPI